MKMIYAIIRNDDKDNLVYKLNEKGFSVTTLATTGGFLKQKNVTLLIGTEEEKVDKAIEVIRKACGRRKQMVYHNPSTSGGMNLMNYMPMAAHVDVGGATVFVMDVERFEKI